MAGTNSGFDATVVRAALESAMTMGLVNTATDQPIFRWLVQPSYGTLPVDQAGFPYNWSEPASLSGPQQITDIQVNCAVSYLGDSEEGTVVGLENAVKVNITVLDTDMKLLMARGGRYPDQILLSQYLYNVDYVTSVGLFSVDVYTIYATAVDQ